MAMMHPHCHIVASNDQCQQLYGNWMAKMHPHCHIVASNDQFSNFMATDISFWQCQRVIAKLLPCHCWYKHCWQWWISQQWTVHHCWQLNGNDTPNGRTYIARTFIWWNQQKFVSVPYAARDGFNAMPKSVILTHSTYFHLSLSWFAARLEWNAK